MAFLKGQGYKGLQRMRYPEIKILYDGVREAIQRHVDGIISFDSEKNKQLEDARKETADKRRSKRKRTAHDDELSKKLKLLRTDTVDEMRNYLRLVDFENPKKTEDAEKKSKISTFSVVELAEGDYLIFHREDESFQSI